MTDKRFSLDTYTILDKETVGVKIVTQRKNRADNF